MHALREAQKWASELLARQQLSPLRVVSMLAASAAVFALALLAGRALTPAASPREHLSGLSVIASVGGPPETAARAAAPTTVLARSTPKAARHAHRRPAARRPNRATAPKRAAAKAPSPTQAPAPTATPTPTPAATPAPVSAPEPSTHGHAPARTHSSSQGGSSFDSSE